MTIDASFKCLPVSFVVKWGVRTARRLIGTDRRPLADLWSI
jgi:hypothetical protein